jgi:hypothetical protein
LKDRCLSCTATCLLHASVVFWNCASCCRAAATRCVSSICRMDACGSVNMGVRPGCLGCHAWRHCLKCLSSIPIVNRTDRLSQTELSQMLAMICKSRGEDAMCCTLHFFPCDMAYGFSARYNAQLCRVLRNCFGFSLLSMYMHSTTSEAFMLSVLIQ